MGPTLLLLLVLTNLAQTHHLCRLTNATISAEKDGCPFCVSLTTTVCSGYCPTKESVYKSPLLSVYQHVCTYKALRYESIRLPGCGVRVEPTYTYPVALSCGCNLCKMHNTDCSRQSIMPDFCSSRRLLL
ncbi:gonadotropin subunit beta-like [Amblyraja radiata]|uniref:gonadotropin subunit beta-like n=1 Tax=Amblyraja radiata TaxID=386614 RepID=UPI0014025055|nr:gonadotropin subunit beta-like [Amblyraja radiata]